MLNTKARMGTSIDSQLCWRLRRHPPPAMPAPPQFVRTVLRSAEQSAHPAWYNYRHVGCACAHAQMPMHQAPHIAEADAPQSMSLAMGCDVKA